MKKQLMNNYTRRIIYLSILVVSFISCDELPVDTKGELAAEQFYSSVADIESGTLGVYSVLLDKLFANSENSCHFWAADDRTAVTGSNKTNFLEFDQMKPLPTNAWQTNGWNQFWEIVGAANTFLDNEEQMRSFTGGADLELLERALGEVHYLRGLAYFEVVRTWGTVPLITSQREITGQEPLASFADIYGLIVSDLTYAKNKLGPTSVNGTYRANKWWAQSLLANVYLTMAGFPLKLGDDYYNLAAVEAKDVIDNGPYDLEEEYGGIMGKKSNNLSEEGNTEAIIAFPAFVPLDGWSAGNYQAETILFGDKVVEKTFFENFPEGHRKDFTFDDVEGVIQYSKEKFGEQDFGSVNKDMNYLRFCELLLIYAEARIRVNGSSDASGLDALNQIKRRAAGLPYDIPNATVDVTSATWEDVVWEKAWELAGEFSRWYDIVRTETLDEVNAIRSPDEPAELLPSPTISEAFPWSPIPANDVSINPGLQK